MTSVQELSSLSALKQAVGSAAEAVAPVRQAERDAHGRSYATGKRKNAIARVWVKAGNGKIVVNGKDYTEYFARPTLRMMINQPFEITNKVGHFDVYCTVVGGGLSGQAGAIRHGISVAIQKYDPDNRPVLKVAKLLRRDPRVVERKKYGLRKARRGMQWAKR
ncbi:MAG: 30S ribosomal protein S9 [Alphaproteobacteria bacterium]